MWFWVTCCCTFRRHCCQPLWLKINLWKARKELLHFQQHLSTTESDKITSHETQLHQLASPLSVLLFCLASVQWELLFHPHYKLTVARILHHDPKHLQDCQKIILHWLCWTCHPCKWCRLWFMDGQWRMSVYEIWKAIYSCKTLFNPCLQHFHVVGIGHLECKFTNVLRS